MRSERNGLASALRLTGRLLAQHEPMPAPRLLPTLAWVSLISGAVADLADSTMATMPLAKVMDGRR